MRRAVLAVAAVAGSACWLGPAAASVPSVGAAAAAAAVVTTPGAAVAVDRTMTDPRITESSGLAASLAHPGVLWTHNDSGNPPLLYALRRDGSTQAAVRLSGVANRDWEAMASYRDPAGRPELAVADIGDNAAARAQVEVALLPEPALHDATVRPARVLHLRYPDGAVDAETLLIDPVARRMYVVSKGFGSTVYAVPRSVWPGVGGAPPKDDGTLVRIATVPLILVTDGLVAPDGHVLLRTYGELAVLRPLTDGALGGELQPLVIARLPAQPQGEGLAWVDSRTVLLSTEGVRQPVLRWSLPADVAALLHDGAPPAGPASMPGPAGTHGPASTPGPASTTGPASAGAAGGAGLPRGVVVATALTGTLALVIGAATLFARSRRRF